MTSQVAAWLKQGSDWSAVGRGEPCRQSRAPRLVYKATDSGLAQDEELLTAENKISPELCVNYRLEDPHTYRDSSASPFSRTEQVSGDVSVVVFLRRGC